MEFAEVASFASLNDAERAARALHDYFAEGERGLVAIQFPVPVPEQAIGIAQWFVDQAGDVHPWEPVSAEGSVLYVPFERHSFPIVAILAALPKVIEALAAIGILVLVAITLITVYKVADSLGGILGSGLVLAVAFISIPILLGIITKDKG